jgi:WD40 repeat protein
VLTVGYSPDGTRIVSASGDGTARIWDARTGTQLLTLVAHGDRVLSAAYSYDGTRIVTASDDRSARIWDAHSGVQLAALLGHSDGVHSAAYAPDGLQVVTASADKTARVWDAPVPADIEAQILWYAAAEPDVVPAPGGRPLDLPAQTRNSAPELSYEPKASAQKAARDEKTALAQTDPRSRDALLLQAFTGYAAAAERASREHWPDDAWRSWRHRRASLARVLAQEGRMQQVADAYRTVLIRGR